MEAQIGQHFFRKNSAAGISKKIHIILFSISEHAEKQIKRLKRMSENIILIPSLRKSPHDGYNGLYEHVS
jgi:hypothetical protein